MVQTQKSELAKELEATQLVMGWKDVKKRDFGLALIDFLKGKTKEEPKGKLLAPPVRAEAKKQIEGIMRAKEPAKPATTPEQASHLIADVAEGINEAIESAYDSGRGGIDDLRDWVKDAKPYLEGDRIHPRLGRLTAGIAGRHHQGRAVPGRSIQKGRSAAKASRRNSSCNPSRKAYTETGDTS